MEESLTQKENITDAISRTFGIGSHDARHQTALSLAYIGDCIYDLVIRTVLTTHDGGKNGSLHHKATKYVNASAQADLIDAIEDELTEEENKVYHRGRNSTNNASKAKHASIIAYRKATGLEALIGYLYLEGRYGRLTELMKTGLDRIGFEDQSVDGCVEAVQITEKIWNQEN
ncbi:MAG: ribonuclease III [Lachnospiraceae bacterium]|nr:ribonuclease III [Lachnospiraceae bacterium]